IEVRYSDRRGPDDDRSVRLAEHAVAELVREDIVWAGQARNNRPRAVAEGRVERAVRLISTDGDGVITRLLCDANHHDLSSRQDKDAIRFVVRRARDRRRLNDAAASVGGIEVV